MIKILAMSGSPRIDSYNKKILRVSVFGAREAGAEVSVVDLNEFPLPIYNADLEQAEGLPKNVKLLKNIFQENHGFLFSLPEYNSSVSGFFKNILDWLSRADNGEPVVHCFNGKVAGLISASTSPLGGIRGLRHARDILESMNVIVMPEEVSIPSAGENIDEFGNFKNEIHRKAIEKLGSNLVDLTLRVRGFNL